MKVKDLFYDFIQCAKYDLGFKFFDNHIYNEYYDKCFFKDAYKTSMYIYDNLLKQSEFTISLDFCKKVKIELMQSNDYIVPYISKFKFDKQNNAYLEITISITNINFVQFYDILYCLELCYLKYCLHNNENLEIISFLNNVNKICDEQIKNSISSYKHDHNASFDEYINDLLNNCKEITSLYEIGNVKNIDFNESVFYKLYDKILTNIIHKYINDKGII